MTLHIQITQEHANVPFVNDLDFFDNYTLAQTIGKGSNGEVKLAYHNLTHNKVAVKIIDKA